MENYLTRAWGGRAWLFILILGPSGCGVGNATPAPWRPEPTGAGVDAGTHATATDLPCDVAELLGARCVPCHADPPNGASESFASYEALTAPSLLDPSRPIIEVAIELMQLTNEDAMPPPPAAAATMDEVAVLRGWLDAGLPMGMCGVDNPYDTPVMCSSGNTWRGGNRESWDMRPGWACIDCHVSMREGPRFTVAGTIYPSAHEPDDCNGGALGGGTPIVEITDAAGQVVQLEPNSVGNFGSRQALTMPYTARILYQGRVRAMVTEQDSGDCNTCHTEAGTEDAPGRILLP
ncbi:MAG: hypothetical protein AB7S26_41980 [Sandaracinaceae bacterium]